LGWANSRAEARQLVTHGHYQVNGKKVDIPSYLLKAGDTVSIKKKSLDSEKIKAVLETNGSRPVPQWLDIDRENCSAKVVNLPEREQIAVPVEEHLIVEFYSK
jgi:small subunit ribosomal protein S4